MFGETWYNKNDPYDLSINGYECDHVFARKSQGAKSGRYSGGVSVYYKSYLKNYVSVVEKSEYGLVWIKIDKSILYSTEDAFICNVYVRDQKSQVLRHEEIDYFELVENGIIKYKNRGKVYVTGDFNSRIGQSADFTDNLCYDLCYDNFLTVGIRGVPAYTQSTQLRTLIFECP